MQVYKNQCKYTREQCKYTREKCKIATIQNINARYKRAIRPRDHQSALTNTVTRTRTPPHHTHAITNVLLMAPTAHLPADSPAAPAAPPPRAAYYSWRPRGRCCGSRGSAPGKGVH